jgi:hypothetical protein
MRKRSRFLMFAMFGCFILAASGLVLGMVYCSFVVFAQHHALESVLSRTIPYFKTIGGLGILGMLCFFMFLLSEMTSKPNGNPKG